jgi:Fe-Mn family superoxide dismutase
MHRSKITRRSLCKTLALGSAAWAATPGFGRLAAQPAAPPAAAAPSGPFKLPPLGYALDALEPHIDAKTMEIHHGKHHAAYVANLNRAVADTPDLGRKPVEELVRDLQRLPENIRAAVRNHGGGHANHALFWQLLQKNNGAKPSGALAQALDKQFGSFTGFQEQFTKAATTVFGSGWAWLTLDAEKTLRVETTANQDSPLSAGRTPLLGIDVWEHAYYLKYQNRRPEYVAAFYQVVNWNFVQQRFQQAGG